MRIFACKQTAFLLILIGFLLFSASVCAATDVNITHIDGNSASGALSAFVRYVNDGNLTIDFNATDANYADLYYSKSRKAFASLIYDDLNLARTKIVPSALKGLWRFDGNTTRDFSNRGNNAINVNATYIPNGKFGGAFSFVPGDQNGIQIADSSTLDANTVLDLSAWIYVTEVGADINTFVSKGDNYALGMNLGKPYFTFVQVGQSGCMLTADGPITTNTWHLIEGQIGTGTTSLYIDGDINASSVQSGCLFGAWGLSLNDLNLTIGGVKGRVDEVMLLAGDLTGAGFSASVNYDSNNLLYNICQDLNFTDSTRCRWDFNIMDVADGNYFVDVNVWKAVDSNYANSSDSNFRIFQNPSLDINVVALDSFSDTNAGNIFSYYGDRNVTIDFNFSVLSGVWDNPIVSIYYSAARNGKENPVFADTIRLLDAGRCADTNFLDSTKCSWDWNIHRSLVIDGNYFIDINLTDDIFSDENSTDQNFQIDNNAPVPNLDYNAIVANVDQNIKLYCSIDANWDIAATNDDCYIPSNNTAVCNSVQGWGDGTGLGLADVNGYYRWALDIPAGSQIFSAFMQEKAFALCGSAPYSSYCPSTGYTIAIELMGADSQGAFNSGSPWGVATAASVNYSLTSAWTAGTWYSSPDLNTLLKSFISRSGYAAGNYIGLRYNHNNVANNKVKLADSFDSGSAPAKLLATYGVGAGQKDCGNIMYRLDLDETTGVNFGFGLWQTYDSAAGIPISSGGNWALEVYVTDRAKNASDVNRFYVVIDKTQSSAPFGSGGGNQEDISVCVISDSNAISFETNLGATVRSSLVIENRCSSMRKITLSADEALLGVVSFLDKNISLLEGETREVFFSFFADPKKFKLSDDVSGQVRVDAGYGTIIDVNLHVKISDFAGTAVAGIVSNLGFLGLSGEDLLDLVNTALAGLLLLIVICGAYFVYLLAAGEPSAKIVVVGGLLLVLLFIFAANSQFFA